jgi:hypothetical protein
MPGVRGEDMRRKLTIILMILGIPLIGWLGYKANDWYYPQRRVPSLHMMHVYYQTYGGLCLLVVAAEAVGFWYLGRERRLSEHRKAQGLCLKCGYNLTGNVSGVCPECGESI